METLGQRLERLRKLKGLTQEELGRRIGVNRTTITGWESGYRTPALPVLVKLAEALEVSLDYLVGLSDWTTPEKHIKLPSTSDHLIPIYNGGASAGTGIFPDDIEPEEYVEVPKGWPGDFGVVVRGNSMEPELHEGDIVVVQRSAEPKNGDLVLVVVDGLVYVKEFRRADNVIVLVSRNPAYPPIIVHPKRTQNVYMLGKVVWSIRKHG